MLQLIYYQSRELTWLYTWPSSYQGIAGASVVMCTLAKPWSGDDHAITAAAQPMSHWTVSHNHSMEELGRVGIGVKNKEETHAWFCFSLSTETWILVLPSVSTHNKCQRYNWQWSRCLAHCHAVPCVPSSRDSARLPHVPYHSIFMVCGWAAPM